MVDSKLADLLKEIADSELSAERNRHKLVQYLEFEDHLLFKSLQIYEKNYLIREDISQFVRNAGYKIDLNDASLFISLYDIDQDEKLNLHEFLNFLVPHSGVINTSRKLAQHSQISNDLNKELADFIVLEIESAKKIQQSLIRLIAHPNWSPLYAFKLIDVEGDGYLDLSNLGRFFRKGYARLDYDGILALCRRLNRGITGKVTYNNFLSWFKEPAERKSLKQ